MVIGVPATIAKHLGRQQIGLDTALRGLCAVASVPWPSIVAGECAVAVGAVHHREGSGRSGDPEVRVDGLACGRQGTERSAEPAQVG